MPTGGFTSPFGTNSNPFGSPFDARKGADANASGVMRQVIEEDENSGPSPVPTFVLKPDSGFGGSFFPQGSPSDPISSGHLQPFGEYPAQYNFARRTSVSAESLKPVADSYDNWSPPVHHKSIDQLGRLKRAIQNNFLFSHLDDEQSGQILGALVEKPIPTEGIKVG